MNASVEVPAAEQPRPSAAPPILAVELDGALVKSNLLLESIMALARQSPLSLLYLPFWLLKGAADLKQRLADRVFLDVTTLPYRADVLAHIEGERDRGRTVVLANGGHTLLAARIADHLGLFNEVVSAGSGRSAASDADRLVINPKKSVTDYLKPLRLRHWLKNFLIFVPLLAAHRMGESALLGKLALAFLAFGCVTSSGYLMNDLLDLQADRRHPRKRLRPFAAGDLSLYYAFAAIPALLGAGCLIGAMVSGFFLAALTIYFALSLTYSLYLKRIVLLDVIVLAGLYTIRILAGSAAVDIWPSHWLLAFSTFLFFSLALVKRYGELEAMRRIDGERARARSYELSDTELLAAMGVASGYLAVLVLALYINRDAAEALYRRYELMWFLCPLLLYWISHFWLIAHRGEMPDDPVVFAITDRTSRIVILLMLAVGLLAI